MVRIEHSLPGHGSFPCPIALPQQLTLHGVMEEFRQGARWSVCELGRYRCSYFEWGEGPPLVFIPGLCDDALSFIMPSALLRRHFRCISYNLPTGNGDAARLGTYKHSSFVADLFALLEHVGADKSYLFGSSFGSTIALAAMHQAPERFPRAVLQGGFARRPLAASEVWLARLARYWPWPMHLLPLRRAALQQTHFAPFSNRPRDVWEYYLERNGAAPMRAVAHRALVLHQVDLRAVLPRIQQPILLVCGDYDPLVCKDCEDVLMAGLPRATRAELLNCGHMPQFSHPEIMADLIQRFLTIPLPEES